MDTLVAAAAFLGSLLGAFVIQKAALQGIFRLMEADRRDRH